MKSAMLRSRRPAKPAQDRTNKEMAEIFKSLADENRLQILPHPHARGRLHVSKICDELDESQPAVSHHLTQLRHAGLVDFPARASSTIITSRPNRLALLTQFFPNAGRAQQVVAFGDLEVMFPHQMTESAERPDNIEFHGPPVQDWRVVSVNL